MCRLGSASAGTYPVIVTFPSLGNSRYTDDIILNFTYQLIVSSVAPLSGSVAGNKLHCTEPNTPICHYSSEHVKQRAPSNTQQKEYDEYLLTFILFLGGTLLTVSGFGFSRNATVTVGSEECTVIHASDTELKCKTPAVSVHATNCCFLWMLFPCSILQEMSVKCQKHKCAKLYLVYL